MTDWVTLDLDAMKRVFTSKPIQWRKMENWSFLTHTNGSRCRKCRRRTELTVKDSCLGCKAKESPNDFYPCAVCRRPLQSVPKLICVSCEEYVNELDFSSDIKRQWIKEITTTVDFGHTMEFYQHGPCRGFYMSNRTWKKLSYLPCFDTDGVCVEKQWYPEIKVREVRYPDSRLTNQIHGFPSMIDGTVDFDGDEFLRNQVEDWSPPTFGYVDLDEVPHKCFDSLTDEEKESFAEHLHEIHEMLLTDMD